jgi:hypothetical protein
LRVDRLIDEALYTQEDMKFNLFDVHNMPAHYQKLGFKDVDESSIEMVSVV